MNFVTATVRAVLIAERRMFELPLSIESPKNREKTDGSFSRSSEVPLEESPIDSTGSRPIESRGQLRERKEVAREDAGRRAKARSTQTRKTRENGR